MGAWSPMLYRSANFKFLSSVSLTPAPSLSACFYAIGRSFFGNLQRLYSVCRGDPAMAINGRRNKPIGPGAVPGASTKPGEHRFRRGRNRIDEGVKGVLCSAWFRRYRAKIRVANDNNYGFERLRKQSKPNLKPWRVKLRQAGPRPGNRSLHFPVRPSVQFRQCAMRGARG